jgi:hypothetical protein
MAVTHQTYATFWSACRPSWVSHHKSNRQEVPSRVHTVGDVLHPCNKMCFKAIGQTSCLFGAHFTRGAFSGLLWRFGGSRNASSPSRKRSPYSTSYRGFFRIEVLNEECIETCRGSRVHEFRHLYTLGGRVKERLQSCRTGR